MASNSVLGTLVAVLSLAIAGCAVHAKAPQNPKEDARTGHAPAQVSLENACGDWRDAVGGGVASKHTAFAERSPEACFVRVHHGAGIAVPESPPAHCGYPEDGKRTADGLAAQAGRHERIARGEAEPLPMALDCDLPPEVLQSAAAHNARVLRATARRISDRQYPYGAIGTFGFGQRQMGQSHLVPWRPGDACMELDKAQMDLLSIMRIRASRAAAAYHGGVAPVVIVSGSAVYSPLYEAFALAHLASCQFSVPLDVVLLEPCANHTHTNIRNVGGLVTALGARTAYLVTDDALQGAYLQEWNVFHLMGGSIDQRALRDWGYLLGSWRQAREGIESGYWYTPYRFWAAQSPADTFTCLY